jgi:RNA polymerase-interacting CarD/CdnL/TRCF family regulator
MTKKSSISVGDPLVRFSTIYEVFEIKERKANDATERIVFYKQVYASRQNDTLVCSIPEDSLDKTNIRQPLAESEVDDLLNDLATPGVEQISFKRNSASKRLNDNEAAEIVRVIKNLWVDKQVDGRNFSMSKKSTYVAARQRLAQEVAYVKDISIADAEALIEGRLEAAGEMFFTSLAVE